MRIVYRAKSECPGFVSSSVELGQTLILNAPRPLYGDSTDDTWELPFVCGRHYAAIDPNSVYAPDRIAANRKLDAVVVRYIADDTLESIGTWWYNAFCGGVPRWCSRSELSQKGLDIINRHEIIDDEDSYRLIDFPQEMNNER